MERRRRKQDRMMLLVSYFPSTISNGDAAESQRFVLICNSKPPLQPVHVPRYVVIGRWFLLYNDLSKFWNKI